jgi:hypothetical protein
VATAGARGGLLIYTTVWMTGGRDVPKSEKDRLAAEVEDRWVKFQDGLSNKRRYPVEQFRAFWEAGKRYAELTRNCPNIVAVLLADIRSADTVSPVTSWREVRYCMCVLRLLIRNFACVISLCSSLPGIHR